MKRYWLYDPLDSRVTYWSSAKERDEEAARLIASYCEDGEWLEEVELITAGEVTHTSQPVRQEMRPDDIDEDGYDGEGSYWGDHARRGSYSLEPLSSIGEENAAGN